MATIVDFFNKIQNFSYSQYCQTGAHPYAAIILLHLGTLTFVINVATKNYSWFDRLWSILPIFFAVHMLYHQVHCDHLPISIRQYLMFGFILLWGVRLTYNIYRKGGFSSAVEDHRWVYLRDNYPRVLFELLNFFYISYYQLFLIYWITAPITYAQPQSLTLTDILLSVAWVAMFVGQTIADKQQYNFQTQKYKMLKQNNNKHANLPMPYKRGFITSGLFRYSRHPNFFCETCMWWVMFLFSVGAVGLNLSGIGAGLLNLLFLGSTALTEKISSEKYPEYSQYQKQVPMLIPSLPRSTKSKQN